MWEILLVSACSQRETVFDGFGVDAERLRVVNRQITKIGDRDGGTFDGATVGPYPHRFTMYLTLGIVNTIEVYAVDEAGNRSAPATMTIDLRAP